MTKSWYVRQADSVYGPYGSRKLQEMAINGEISQDCEVSNSEKGPWITAEKLKGIQFAAAPPPKINTSVDLATDLVSTKSTGAVQTIELTSKKFKLVQIIGFLIGLPGGAICLYSLSIKSFALLPFGASIFLVGLLITLAGAVLAWWHHG